MIHSGSVVLVATLSLGAPLGAQPRQGQMRESVDREAARLAALVAREPSADTSALEAIAAARTDRSDNVNDWDLVRRLTPGTRVVVTSITAQGIDGRLARVDEDALEVVVRRGRDQTLRRQDVREVRLDHTLSIAQHVGLGMLIGGLSGFLVGTAADCDCELRGLAPIVYSGSGILWGTVGGLVSGGVAYSRPGRLVYALPKP